MSRSTGTGKSPGSEAKAPDSKLRNELKGIGLALFAVFLAGALVAQSLSDVRGSFGWVGENLAQPLANFFGWPAAALLPIAPAAHALRLFGRMDEKTDRKWMVFLLGLVVLLPIALSHAAGGDWQTNPLSGIWGSFAAFYLRQFAGNTGTWIILLLALSALMASTLSWNPIRVVLGKRITTATPVTTGDSSSASAVATATMLEPPPEEMPALDLSLMAEGVEDVDEVGAAKPEKKKREKKSRAEVTADISDRVAAAINLTANTGDLLSDDALPSPELLTPAPPRNAEAGKRELDLMGQKLMDALRTFKVEGELIGRTTGPVVTQYEVAPAAGVKVRQIANLSNDLALAMRAQSIRIVAPIPGKGAVGVEVPNPNPEIVAFREMLESAAFSGARAALPIALGKNLEGKAVVADLAKMPHLLIAGATGSGKSVCINTIITSLVYRHTSKTLRLLLVDPKMVELSVYNVLPHLRHKVVTDNRDAAAVLKWAVFEMQERYELLAANGARNIQDFNRKVTEGAKLKRPKNIDIAFENSDYEGGILPYIVLVIDELADLMMTVQGEVETPLAMLAQKARAIGIHLILATQRPSVNVITGLIKANFPSRIAFRVASQVDSRTILDGIGAEALLGNGDMLFIAPEKSEPARLQGAYISSEDTEQLMTWYQDRRDAKKQMLEDHGFMTVADAPSEEDILDAVRKREAEAGAGGDNDDINADDRDKLFREAAEIVIQHQQGSTSLLQRRLKVGYGRAARIIDQLHAAGILGPPDGSKPREVLKGLGDLESITPNS